MDNGDLRTYATHWDRHSACPSRQNRTALRAIYRIEGHAIREVAPDDVMPMEMGEALGELMR